MTEARRVEQTRTGDEDVPATAEDPNNCSKDHRSQIIQTLPGLLTVKLKNVNYNVFVFLSVGRRVRNEKETYSPDHGDLSAGCNFLWTAFPTTPQYYVIPSLCLSLYR